MTKQMLRVICRLAKVKKCLCPRPCGPQSGGANPVRVRIGNSNFPSEERKAAYGEKAKKYNSREVL